MDSLTVYFNVQIHWHIFILPLWILLIFADIEKQESRRRRRILNLQREFNAKAMKQSRDRYYRQVSAKYFPRK